MIAFNQYFYRMKILFGFLIFGPLMLMAQQKVDLLITNGRILDGTGNSWYRGDIAVNEGKIVGIGNLKNIEAVKTIDAQNKIVAPGFIDVHTHIEDDEVKNPTADNFIYNGVTSVVTGNCGMSATDLNKYFTFLDSLKTSVNVASLIGHNDVRKKVMGTANRVPTPAEQVQMEALVTQAMKDGAVGLSTGLIYIPGTYAQTSEVIGLAKQDASLGGGY